jgi:hypothetical protein
MAMFHKNKAAFIAILVLAAVFCGSCGQNTATKYTSQPSANTQSDNSHHTGYDGIFQFTILEGKARIDYVNSCDGDVVVPEKIDNFVVTEIGDSAFYQNKCSSINLPSTIRYIRDGAFYRCHNIKDITIPAETVFIDGNPFFRCSGLEYIRVQPGNTQYRDIDGVLYDSTGTTLIAYPEGRNETEYEIPEGVTKIAVAAFGYESCLETVTIPPSVVEFPDYNVFSIYEHISFILVPGSSAEEYACRYGIPYRCIA